MSDFDAMADGAFDDWRRDEAQRPKCVHCGAALPDVWGIPWCDGCIDDFLR